MHNHPLLQSLPLASPQPCERVQSRPIVGSKKLTSCIIWCVLNELVHDVLGRLETLLQGRSVQVHFPEELPPVELDHVLIGQILTNLIENAI